MSLETTLIDITAKLRQGKFPNEQSISQGIVLRVLQELGWDTQKFNRGWTRMNADSGNAACHAEPVEASQSYPVPSGLK